MSLRSTQRKDLAGAVLALAWASSACEPKLVVGKLTEVQESSCSAGGAASAPENVVVEVPWTTSFEDGECDYIRAGGFCYNDPEASYDFVAEPVRMGSRSAAFTVKTDPSVVGKQTRCVLQGTLPTDAVYGAWFYVPALAEVPINWNLFHFQGGTPGGPLPGQWDVSLANSDDGSLHLYVRDFLNGPQPNTRIPNPVQPIPIGSWFHVEFRLLRAADATGAIALYQDEVPLLEASSILTESTPFTQWYVGNLADELIPPDSTIYVDDVTVRAEP